MAVTKIRLLDSDGSYDENGPKYRLRYYIETNSKTDGPKTVLNSLPFSYGDNYAMGSETDINVIANNFSIEQVDEANFKGWFAEIDFGVFESKSNAEVDNPLLATIEESYGFTSRAKPVAFDLNNKAYMNTAGELIEHERPTNYRTMQFIRNELTINNALVETVKDAINSTTWKGYAPFTVKVSSITHEGLHFRVLRTANTIA